MTPVTKGIIAFVLVAGAGPAGFAIYHLVFHNHPLQAPTDSAPAAHSAPLPPAPTSAPTVTPALPDTPTQTTRIQRSAPLTLPSNITLPDSSGRMHSLSEYRGHPLVLNFWATWCEPCQREIPLLQALHQETAGSVQIVGVAVDFQKDVLQYAQTRGITYPLLMGEKDGLAAVNAFGMETAFPFTVFADAQGNIVAVKVGELHADEARLILEQVHAVDGGQRALADARSTVADGLRILAIAHAQQAPSGAAAAARKS